MRMLEKSRDGRFAGAGELRREIDRLLASGGRPLEGVAPAALVTPYPPRQAHGGPVAPPSPGGPASRTPAAPAVGAVTVRTPPPGELRLAAAAEPAFAAHARAAALPRASGREGGGPHGSAPGWREPGATEDAIAAAVGSGRGPMIVVAFVLVVGGVVLAAVMLT
jgi:hypothetical protein